MSHTSDIDSTDGLSRSLTADQTTEYETGNQLSLDSAPHSLHISPNPTFRSPSFEDTKATNAPSQLTWPSSERFFPRVVTQNGMITPGTPNFFYYTSTSPDFQNSFSESGRVRNNTSTSPSSSILSAAKASHAHESATRGAENDPHAPILYSEPSLASVPNSTTLHSSLPTSMIQVTQNTALSPHFTLPVSPLTILNVGQGGPAPSPRRSSILLFSQQETLETPRLMANTPNMGGLGMTPSMNDDPHALFEYATQPPSSISGQIALNEGLLANSLIPISMITSQMPTTLQRMGTRGVVHADWIGDEADLEPRKRRRRHTNFEDDTDFLPSPQVGMGSERGWGSQRVRRRRAVKWTDSEDNLLFEAVRMFGTKNWKAIAEKVGGGRTGDMCSQHWHRVLCPSIRKEGWSQEEDAMLRREVERFGTSNWTRVAAGLRGRTDIQCRYRWGRLGKDEGGRGWRDRQGGGGGGGGREEDERIQRNTQPATVQSFMDSSVRKSRMMTHSQQTRQPNENFGQDEEDAR
ncbi:putative myb transcription factor [Blattamonas nauphoetae]|uniref:Myb transcription factor n=1 Tax=Blattamonas nauphoetae TaxID=2049346 RepID=A0ABQ9XX27_9EUKA|nr:putative myb transcription factor [Blattamonas nauphoetae]